MMCKFHNTKLPEITWYQRWRLIFNFGMKKKKGAILPQIKGGTNPSYIDKQRSFLLLFEKKFPLILQDIVFPMIKFRIRS